KAGIHAVRTRWIPAFAGMTRAATATSLLLALVPLRHRPHHLAAGHVERPHGVVLAVDDLHEDAAAQHVLAVLVELHALPRHDEVLGGYVRLTQRLADRFRLGALGAVDRIGHHHQAGEGARRVAGEIGVVAAVVQVVHLFD